jgi:hypothetical protein
VLAVFTLPAVRQIGLHEVTVALPYCNAELLVRFMAFYGMVVPADKTTA